MRTPEWVVWALMAAWFVAALNAGNGAGIYTFAETAARKRFGAWVFWLSLAVGLALFVAWARALRCSAPSGCLP